MTSIIVLSATLIFSCGGGGGGNVGQGGPEISPDDIIAVTDNSSGTTTNTSAGTTDTTASTSGTTTSGTTATTTGIIASTSGNTTSGTTATTTGKTDTTTGTTASTSGNTTSGTTTTATGKTDTTLKVVAADSTTNASLTGTTSSTEGTIVEPEVNSTIEGTIDTGKDTGTTTAAGITEEAGKDIDNSVINVTDSSVITEDINIILSGGSTVVKEDAAGNVAVETGTSTTTETTTAADTTSGTGSTETTTASSDSTTTGTDTTASTEGTSADKDTTASTGSTTTGTDTTASTGSTTTGTDTTVSTGSTTTGTDTTASTGSTTTGTDTTASTTSTTSTEETVIAESTVDTGTGETVEDLENDEDVPQAGLQYSIDSSQGKWYEVAEKELFSSQTLSSIKVEIVKLRNEIKAVTDSYKKGKSKHDEASAKIKQLRKKIADLRASIGEGGRMSGGIYTAWAKQNLYLNITGGEPGYYRLVIVAKNNGTLPDDYDRFTFNIDEGSDTIGGISVKASDDAYYRGSTIIKLDKAAGTQLNILWTNDAYLKGKYDANVNIKKIALIKIKEPKKRLKAVKKFKGDQFSFMDGRWFFDKHEAYTYWADQVIGYTFKNMEEGQYEVTIEAVNHGTLPLAKDYKEFKIEVDSEYDSASVAIPADEKKYQKETFTMNFPEGDSTLYLTWTNDSYQENKYDANIKYRFVSVKKSKQSNLTAYLLKTKPGNRLFVLTAFIMISAVIAGIYMRNRRSEA